VSRGPHTDEREPDYRFTLANERTFLAWMRTALALLAAGVAVVQLVPHFSVVGARTTVGVLLGLLSVLVSVGGVLRWRGVQLAMRRGQPLPSTGITWLLAGGLTMLAVVAIILLLGEN
jgi:putative membrane protein